MYKALRNFSGLQFNMKRGEVRDIKDKSLVKDLLKAGYIEEVDLKNVDNKKLAEAEAKLEEANKKLAEVEAKLEEANKKLAETDEKSEKVDEKSEETDEKSEKTDEKSENQ